MTVEQVGGTHYEDEKEQHWDRVARKFGAGYFIGCGTKYMERCLDKGSAVEDLEKAASFALKLAELIRAGIVVPTNPEDPDYPKPPAEAVPKAKRTRVQR